jgi:hypothetical protein
MWEAAAYSQNVLKVMLDPPTWAVAAIAIFWLRSLSLPARIALALAANLAFTLLFLVWPAGDSGRYYAWIAVAYELAATAIWLAIFIGFRRLFGRGAAA